MGIGDLHLAGQALFKKPEGNMLNRAFMICCAVWWSFGLNAEIYDPFHLETEFDPVSDYHVVYPSNGSPIFYVECGHSHSVKQLIDQARSEMKHIEIDVANIPKERIVVGVGRYRLPSWEHLLKKCYKKDLIKVSDKELEFEWVEVTSEAIQTRLWGKWIKISFGDGSSENYLLTEEQRRTLNVLLDRGSNLEINITALKYWEPYRDLIPATKVIRRQQLLN